MNCPFTPFLVLFCHAIATATADTTDTDTSDLRRLGDFVSSLQSAADVAEAAERFCRLCQVFHRVAELYVSAKMKRRQQQQEIRALAGSSSSTEEQQKQQNMSNNNNNSNDNNRSASTNTGPTTPYPGILSASAAAAPDDLEPYLLALGIPNVNHNSSNGDPTAIEFEQGFTGDSSTSASLGNWFAGNVNIMSLLETDLSNLVNVNPPPGPQGSY